MGRILLTWELGSGLGHLLPLRVVGEHLERRGHVVAIAVRQPGLALGVFGKTGISVVPAPVVPKAKLPPTGQIFGFAHMLAGAGFGEEGCLEAFYLGWNALFDEVKPDLVVADHSPFALLALRGRGTRAVTLGLPFYCPPDLFPLPHWTPAGQPPRQDAVVPVERQSLKNANRVLQSHRRPEFKQLSQIFNDVDEVMLASYVEFDHFGPRPDKRYWGHWHATGGTVPSWPDVPGPKVFVYVKPFPAIEFLLNNLRLAGLPSVVFAGGLPDALVARFACATLRFETTPLDLYSAGKQCDLAILTGGHGTTASILLAGKPCLLIPLYVEQLLNSQTAVRFGAGRCASADSAAAMDVHLHAMLSEAKYRQAAQSFAARYAGFVPGQQIPQLVDRLETILQGPPIDFS